MLSQVRSVDGSYELGAIRGFSSIPKTMRCVDITKYGGPEVIEVYRNKR